MNAAENGTAVTVTALLDARARVDAVSKTGFTALIVAAAGGHADCVALLADRGADVAARHAEGVDALMYAAAGGSHPCEIRRPCEIRSSGISFGEA